MLRRMVPDPSSPDSSGGGGDARPRGGGGALFAVPRLFVGFAAKRVAPDGESSRSPTSPLDPKALLLRSPRSPRRTWGAPGLVDALAADTAAANCLLSPRLRLVRQHSSPPKGCGGHSQPELGKTMSCCPAPDTAAAGAGAGAGMSVPCPCSRFQLRHGDLKSGPEATGSADTGAHLASKRHSFDLGKLPGPGSLPVPASASASSSAARRFVGSVSASEIEQSEDYTRIIARGPNPKTTHIFGDCILEPRTVGCGDSKAVESGEGGAGCYFVVKRAAPGAGDFLSSCFACKKKLEGNDIYIYRGEKAFCSANCRDQEIQLEEEAENNTSSGSPGSSSSSSSSSNDDIFMAGMVVAT
ncbi:FCS-Like Zinc finger 10 [Zea mays]|uniref:Protein MARD1 n=1 Tax=Zea mays TaxID=4577 RepID=A0A1D6MJB0_MAIZE|nr:FCS-Like Zinc finger 10 [Zea mays]XP_020405678.1 FCS-Like Zinc finger 10 [Zea mays]ONM29404.1 Protein MARD1 [Zea mays]|eukprot:XP_008664449.2 uncharacterized protein LOC103643065 [Zea mays]